MTIDNEFEKLLHYLEEKSPKTSTPKQERSGQFKEVNTLKEAIKNKRKTQQKKKPKKEAVKEKTKRILEESIEEFSKIPHENRGRPVISSDGFDTKQFELLMRSKLIEEYKTRQSYERPYISCGELVHCLRQNYYVRKRYQVKISEQFKFSYLYLMQRVGNVIHDIFQELYNFTEVEKTVVSEKYKVKGRLDALKGSTIYEIKSLDPNKFKGKYIQAHYIQCLIYAYILITEYDYKIENITLIYVLRDLKTVRPFDLKLDFDLAKKYLNRAPVLLKALENNIVIDPIGSTKEDCRYCAYKKFCEKDKCEKIKPPFLITSKKRSKKPEAVFKL
ncbi:MAG: CRISPR-associated protein Cas4 [Candidatus Heimdallarchaeaceae archaeon]